MFRLTQSLAVGAALLVGMAVFAAGEPPAPPRVKPLATRSIPVQPWETSSISPFGGSRFGGTDQRCFAFSPDGTLLATEDAGGWQLELWDVAAGKSLGRFGRIDDPVALTFSPDGKTLLTASASGLDVCTVELWDVARRVRLRSLDDEANLIAFTTVAFAPDGKTIALAATQRRGQPGTSAVHLWDVASGDEVGCLEGIPVAQNIDPSRRSHRDFDSLSYSPDGRTLAVISDRQLWLWEVATDRERCLLGMLPPVYRRGSNFEEEWPAVVAYAPDGRTVAAGGPDGVVRFWDVPTGAELLPLVGHRRAVRAVRFAADGKTLWSFGWDKQVLNWPVAEARRPGPPPQPLTAPALAALWDDLGGDDLAAAEDAIRTLVAAPATALPFLRDRVRPVPPVDVARIARLVEDLKKVELKERRRAMVELRTLGDLAIPTLWQAREKDSRNTVARRLLVTLERQYPSREQVQALRAVRAVERMGTDEARRLLAELAKGAAPSRLTQQAQAALDRSAKRAPPLGADVPLEKLWAELASADAAEAFRAVRALSARSAPAVSYLGQRLQAVAARDDGDDPARIARLIADLAGEDFAVRDRATKELAQLGQRAEAPLRQALQGSVGLEAKRRIEALLAQVGRRVPTAEQRQAERALEVLEWAGTDDARRVLQDLAQRGKNRWLTEAAAASLRRGGG